MKEKVIIEVEDREEDGTKRRYVSSVKNGMDYISVGFTAKRYGSSSPCDNDDEIDRAIKNCKEWIIKEGDIPILQDKRKKATLEAWR